MCGVAVSDGQAEILPRLPYTHTIKRFQSASMSTREQQRIYLYIGLLLTAPKPKTATTIKIPDDDDDNLTDCVWHCFDGYFDGTAVNAGIAETNCSRF